MPAACPIRPFVLAVALAGLFVSSGAPASARAVRTAAPLTAARSLANASLPTPAAADAIVKRLWAQREQALAALDVKGIGPVETAAVVQRTPPTSRPSAAAASRRRMPTRCCASSRKCRSASVAPAFFAQVRTSNATGKFPWYLLVVTRDHGAWKFAHLTLGGYGAAPPLQALTRSGGATASVTTAVKARALHLAQMAFQHAKAHTAAVTHTDYGATVHVRSLLRTGRDGITASRSPAARS